MPRHQLIDHICALRRIGEKGANEFDQFLSFIVNESSFIEEIADVCQRCLLQGNPFKPIRSCPNTKTYQEFGKIRKLEPRRHTPNDEGRLRPYEQHGKTPDA
jgi:hypothetical protein